MTTETQRVPLWFTILFTEAKRLGFITECIPPIKWGDPERFRFTPMNHQGPIMWVSSHDAAWAFLDGVDIGRRTSTPS